MSAEILEAIEQERQKLLAVIDSCNARVDKLLAARDALDGYNLGSLVSLDGRVLHQWIAPDPPAQADDDVERRPDVLAARKKAEAAKPAAKAKAAKPAAKPKAAPAGRGAARAAESRQKVVAAMAGHGRCRMDDIVKRAGLNIDTVRVQLRQMGETGDVERTGGGPLTRYEYRVDGPPTEQHPPELGASEPEADDGVLARSVIAIVDQNPGKLTVDRIAQALGVHPDRATPVVIQLARSRELHCRVDQTYELGECA